MRYGISIWLLFCLLVIKGVWAEEQSDVLIWFWGCSSLGGFVQRAGNIPLWTVSHSDFPLRTENLSEMFHTILGYSSWVCYVVVWLVKNFCVTIGWAKYPHKVENLTTQKDTPFGNKSTKTSKNSNAALVFCQQRTNFQSKVSLEFPKASIWSVSQLWTPILTIW